MQFNSEPAGKTPVNSGKKRAPTMIEAPLGLPKRANSLTRARRIADAVYNAADSYHEEI
jgi:hypothetical protein